MYYYTLPLSILGQRDFYFGLQYSKTAAKSSMILNRVPKVSGRLRPLGYIFFFITHESAADLRLSCKRYWGSLDELHLHGLTEMRDVTASWYDWEPRVMPEIFHHEVIMTKMAQPRDGGLGDNLRANDRYYMYVMKRYRKVKFNGKCFDSNLYLRSTF